MKEVVMDNNTMPFDTAMGCFQPMFDRIKAGLEAKGYPSFWVDEIPSLNPPYDIFLRRGKMHSGVKCYLSGCSHYNGRWLAGGSGAIDCAVVDGLLPGIVGEDICTKDHENCPLKRILSEV